MVLASKRQDPELGHDDGHSADNDNSSEKLSKTKRPSASSRNKHSNNMKQNAIDVGRLGHQHKASGAELSGRQQQLPTPIATTTSGANMNANSNANSDNNCKYASNNKVRTNSNNMIKAASDRMTSSSASLGEQQHSLAKCYEEIDQIYDYIRGLGPLPPQLRKIKCIDFERERQLQQQRGHPGDQTPASPAPAAADYLRPLQPPQATHLHAPTTRQYWHPSGKIPTSPAGDCAKAPVVALTTPAKRPGYLQRLLPLKVTLSGNSVGPLVKRVESLSLSRTALLLGSPTGEASSSTHKRPPHGESPLVRLPRAQSTSNLINGGHHCSSQLALLANKRPTQMCQFEPSSTLPSGGLRYLDGARGPLTTPAMIPYYPRHHPHRRQQRMQQPARMMSMTNLADSRRESPDTIEMIDCRLRDVRVSATSPVGAAVVGRREQRARKSSQSPSSNSNLSSKHKSSATSSDSDSSSSSSCSSGDATSSEADSSSESATSTESSKATDSSSTSSKRSNEAPCSPIQDFKPRRSAEFWQNQANKMQSRAKLASQQQAKIKDKRGDSVKSEDDARKSPHSTHANDDHIYEQIPLNKTRVSSPAKAPALAARHRVYPVAYAANLAQPGYHGSFPRPPPRFYLEAKGHRDQLAGYPSQLHHYPHGVSNSLARSHRMHHMSMGNLHLLAGGPLGNSQLQIVNAVRQPMVASRAVAMNPALTSERPRSMAMVRGGELATLARQSPSSAAQMFQLNQRNPHGMHPMIMWPPPAQLVVGGPRRRSAQERGHRSARRLTAIGIEQNCPGLGDLLAQSRLVVDTQTHTPDLGVVKSRRVSKTPSIDKGADLKQDHPSVDRKPLNSLEDLESEEDSSASALQDKQANFVSSSSFIKCYYGKDKDANKQKRDLKSPQQANSPETEGRRRSSGGKLLGLIGLGALSPNEAQQPAVAVKQPRPHVFEHPTLQASLVANKSSKKSHAQSKRLDDTIDDSIDSSKRRIATTKSTKMQATDDLVENNSTNTYNSNSSYEAAIRNGRVSQVDPKPQESPKGSPRLAKASAVAATVPTASHQLIRVPRLSRQSHLLSRPLPKVPTASRHQPASTNSGTASLTRRRPATEFTSATVVVPQISSARLVTRQQQQPSVAKLSGPVAPARSSKPMISTNLDQHSTNRKATCEAEQKVKSKASATTKKDTSMSASARLAASRDNCTPACQQELSTLAVSVGQTNGHHSSPTVTTCTSSGISSRLTSNTHRGANSNSIGSSRSLLAARRTPGSGGDASVSRQTTPPASLGRSSAPAVAALGPDSLQSDSFALMDDDDEERELSSLGGSDEPKFRPTHSLTSSSASPTKPNHHHHVGPFDNLRSFDERFSNKSRYLNEQLESSNDSLLESMNSISRKQQARRQQAAKLASSKLVRSAAR